MSGFQFKQFFIAHDRCAMKVNTDGILLGALVDINHAHNILDLGTGTGLIAIMLAQRADYAQITALELEQNAFQQANENALHCPWFERIEMIQADVLQWKSAKCYDLIVSNPPYFEHSLASRNAERDLARSATSSHFAWLIQAKNWLSEKGKICFILPFESGEKLVSQAEQIGLYCIEHWKIKTKPTSSYKRSVLTFSLQKQQTQEKTLMIYNEHHQYSDEFKQLTKDFYLYF
ncbi:MULTISPECIES: tRNA1(Val) (adenine(37)-N6)-methyltransferase [Glaesserella]|uniref:tRNA1(Val) (adenine(37)-N6)-methyltransferase n=1 Tax=Glaesserella australis TaxID=2094024 RepID=A0A328C0B9_9PAST|nr:MULTISPECIES: methyltransferase [Glaesserella]AUI66559.1 tRNA (adenosine(37)-N6)-methyltransferase TrmM [Glaesserella sp. 15-184]RAL18732.1 tRNA (adenosine(37)-N6)-methyltransferase TrmM [Glaesserella australis]